MGVERAAKILKAIRRRCKLEGCGGDAPPWFPYCRKHQALVKPRPDRKPGSEAALVDSRNTWIYFIEMHDGKAVKVGRADNVWRRLGQLQNAHPHDLKLLSFLEGPPNLEFVIHAALQGHNISREWFRPNEHLDEIINLAKEGKAEEIYLFCEKLL